MCVCLCGWQCWIFKSPGSKIGVHVQVQDRIRILLNTLGLGGAYTHTTTVTSCHHSVATTKTACTLTRTMSHIGTHTQTHMKQQLPGESAVILLQLWSQRIVCVKIITHEYTNTHKLILSHLGPKPNPPLTLIPDQCSLLKGA